MSRQWPITLTCYDAKGRSSVTRYKHPKSAVFMFDSWKNSPYCGHIWRMVLAVNDAPQISWDREIVNLFQTGSFR
jgi:hypothetical protein